MRQRRGRRWRRVLALGLGLLLACSPTALALDEVATAQLISAAVLAEQNYASSVEAIRILVNQCIESLAPTDPLRATLQSVLLLLDSDVSSGEAVALLLRSAIDAQGAATSGVVSPETSEPGAATGGAASPETGESGTATGDMGGFAVADAGGAMSSGSSAQGIAIGAGLPEVGELGLPVYETADFSTAIVQDVVLVDVPASWGNNESGRALTSYSPVNDSGAISPTAGTLTISYFPAEGQSDAEAFDAYTKNIASMSVTTSWSYEDLSVTALSARKIDFTMSVGANQFNCETVCFAYDGSIYTIELMQGQRTQYDYFPVYHRVVNSAEIGSDESVRAVREQIESGRVEREPEGEAVEPSQPSEPEHTLPIEPSQPDEGTSSQMAGDIGSFQYAINGHVYQFPTPVRELAEGDLPLARDAMIPYDLSSDADMAGSAWTEIVNTQYYYFENALHKEMAGVTNLSGYPQSMLDCTLTALIDTEGDYVDVVLPGGVCVGGSERDILRGFPEFEGRALDGLAGFRDNELLYACNVRDDGCNGYVLIRNDAPFYSAVSIICEGGVIREISFECLGSVRAQGVFL